MSTELLKQALMGKLVGRIASRGVRGAKQYNNNVKKLPIPGLLQNKLAEALGVESLDAFIKQSIAMRVVNNAAGRHVLKRVRPRSAKVDTPPVSPTPTTTTNLPSATPQAGGFNRAYGAVTNYAKANPGKMIGGTAVGTVGVAGIANRNPGFNTPAPSPQGAMQQPQAQMYYGQSQQKVSNFNPVASQLLSKFGYDLEYMEELEGLDGKGPNEKYLSAMKTNWMKERKKAGKSTSIPNSVNTVDKFLDFITKTSSQRLRTTVFALDDDNNLLHGFSDDGFYKFPGGGVDPGEDILEAAKRELLEEAGYQVKSISELPGIESVTGVGKSSAKASMGNTSSLTKYLIAKLGDKDTSVFGSEGDAIANLRLAPVDQVMRGLEGDTLFGSSIAQSNLDALKQIIMQKQAEDHVEMRMRERAKFMKLDELNSLKKRVSSSKDLPEGAHYITLPHGRKAVVETKNGKSYIATILSQTMRPPGRDVTNKLSKAAGFIR